MDPKFLKIAHDELGETEVIRERSLEILRERLREHPILKESFQDETFLLSILRGRKFNIDSAFELFMNLQLASRFYFSFPNNDETQLAKCDRLLDTGILLPLTDRDEYGRLVVIQQGRRRDINNFSFEDEMRFVLLLLMTVAWDEETQIAGIVIISDATEVSLRQLATPNQVKLSLSYLRSCIPFRVRNILLLNYSPIFEFILKVAKIALGEKLRKRLNTVKHNEDLQNYIPISILPKELGGIRPEAEMIENFKKIWEERRHYRHKIISSTVDWSKVQSEFVPSKSKRSIFARSLKMLGVD